MMRDWREAKNVVVARLDNVGDVVMLSPALRTIKENLPQAKLTLWASPAGTTAAPLLPEVDDVLTWKVVWQDVGGKMPFEPEREKLLVRELKKRRFDVAVIFTSFSQSPYGVAYACYLAGIPLRLGQSKEFGGGLLSTAVAPLPDATHQVERNLHLLKSAGFVVQSSDIRLRVPKEARAGAMEKLAARGVSYDAGYVLMHPGASCQARTYPAHRFARVGDLLAARVGLPIVLTGAERERAVVEAVASRMARRPLVLAGATSVPEWAVLIEQATLVVTNHTGAMHLADAFRTPNVVLFSGSDLLSQWRPRHSPSRLLQRPVRCSPCYGFTCPYDMECLDVPPDEVADEACKLLEQKVAKVAGRSQGEV